VGADNIPTCILHERARDQFQSVREGTEGPSLDARHRARTRVQADRECHLDPAAACNQRRVEDDVTRDGYRISQVAVNLTPDVLRRPPEEDRARFRARALGQEREVSAEMSRVAKGGGREKGD